ncbi:MAG TPA: glutamate formimidoyltransferase [Chthonomonadaceae bacterium]|nr:glutamate formimidoyltransferase [Chthonomonadaceae bacterium]
MTALFQCVPNFSEGRRPEVIAAIAEAIASAPGVQLIDYSADADHNRSVMTFLGSAEGIRAAVLAAARVAVACIDLRTHSGAHPRTGAIDVVPVIPLRNASREDAIALAHDVGADLARELALPIYFYEWAARPGRPHSLPDVRRGGFEAFVSALLSDERAPDLGPPIAHPTAGVAIVGARGPLIAYNILLSTPDVEIASAIARRIRQERHHRPELEGVRALGLYLPSQHRAQVSLNLTRPDRTPLPAVFAFVEQEAARLGASAVESEIIGAIPQAALGGQPPEAIRWHAYNPHQILETWLQNKNTD